MFRSFLSATPAAANTVPRRALFTMTTVHRNSQVATRIITTTSFPRSLHRTANAQTCAVASTFTSAQRRCSTADIPSSGSPARDTTCCLAGRGVSIAALRRACDERNASAAPPHAGATTAASSPDGEKEPALSSLIGQEVTVRTRVERVRGRGKLGFLHLRQPPLESLQAVCVGKDLTAQAKAITPESIVDVTGVLQHAASPVQSTTCQHGELHVTALHVVSLAATPLPFPYRDANTKLDTRLNHRVMDLRTERMVAVSRLVSALGEAFRQELLARAFIEVHTPKLIAAASEGGSNVFTVDYFGKSAYLAQSPQLYKQMMLMGDAMRVFEIGPVFRAENSLTHRHLTEFVGLDGEMVIEKSHTEVLDVLEPVMCAMLGTLTTKHGKLIDVLWRQQQQQQPEGEATPNMETSRGVGQRHSLRDVCCEVPSSVIETLGLTCDAAGGTSATPSSSTADPYHARVGGASACRVLRLAFADAAQLLIDKGGADVMAGCTLPLTDFSLPQERRLGELIKARYGVDLYVVDLFPAEARPFYTMPLDATKPDGPTRSYDMYLRGEEICSGAQRVDTVALLEERLAAKKVDRTTVADYMDAFRYGAWPHGGFGLGLERIALFFLDLEDIRHVSLFPRDPKRITP